MFYRNAHPSNLRLASKVPLSPIRSRNKIRNTFIERYESNIVQFTLSTVSDSFNFFWGGGMVGAGAPLMIEYLS